jgi:YVTN family beta-propeller protein
MRRFQWVRRVVVLALAGAGGCGPDGASAVAPSARCRVTAFVTNITGGAVSTIDVKTRTKNHTDITVGTQSLGLAITPDGKTAFVSNGQGGTVSAIDVKSRTKHPTAIGVGGYPVGVAVTSDGKSAWSPTREAARSRRST